MSSIKFTSPPWRKGKVAGAVVADTHSSMSRPEYAEREKEYYGGYLIAESVSPENEPLITAAPDMYEACKRALPILSALVNEKKLRPEECGYETSGYETLLLLKNAILKAEGREE